MLKVRRATAAIDCVPPPTYSHLTIKRKKMQLEKERIWRIEDENRRLLCRLGEIMNRSVQSASSSRSSFQKRCTSSKSFEAVKLKDTNEMQIKRRPHTVAVIQRRRDADNDDKKLLCGCKSRQLATNGEAATPLAIDMTELLCGIQSVEITTKANNDNSNRS